jgi:diguanylate cyclase (GGDEF)-like protein
MEHRTAALWDMALRDELTGAWNRRYFNGFLDSVLRRAVDQRSQVTLLVFDIDNFKHYNDRYGHPAGDEILREAARLMQSVVRTHDVVARIGGDEFAVIFWDPKGPRTPNSQHPHDVRKAAERFQRAIAQHRFPKLGSQAPGALTISGGLASFPWDGRTAAELIDRADAMAMQAKSQGKNAIQFGPGAERGSERGADCGAERGTERGADQPCSPQS